MLPRFSNPHFLPLQTQIVSREDIYSDGNRGAPHAPGYDTETLEQLNYLLETSLPQYVGLAPDSNGKNKKRRRVTIENVNPASLEEPVCMCEKFFRSISISNVVCFSSIPIDIHFSAACTYFSTPSSTAAIFVGLACRRLCILLKFIYKNTRTRCRRQRTASPHSKTACGSYCYRRRYHYGRCAIIEGRLNFQLLMFGYLTFME